MSKPNTKVSFPILGILGLIFITLKLAGLGVVASWSWLWVLSPFWIPIAIAVVMFAIAGILIWFGNK